MDDDLEVFVASGLDIPTALVASEKPGSPDRRCGCGTIIIVATILALLALILRCH